MAVTISTVKLSPELAREIEDASSETGLSPEDLVRVAVRRFVESDRRLQHARRNVQARARAMGVTNEDELEEFMDSLPELDH